MEELLNGGSLGPGLPVNGLDSWVVALLKEIIFPSHSYLIVDTVFSIKKLKISSIMFTLLLLNLKFSK